jgi:hypothetical protein
MIAAKENSSAPPSIWTVKADGTEQQPTTIIAMATPPKESSGCSPLNSTHN